MSYSSWWFPFRFIRIQHILKVNPLKVVTINHEKYHLILHNDMDINFSNVEFKAAQKKNGQENICAKIGGILYYMLP